MIVNHLCKQIFCISLLVYGLAFLIGCDRGDDYKRENTSITDDTDVDQNNDNMEVDRYDEDEAEYPEEKVLDETNLDSEKPLETGTAISLIEKRELLASLMRQKTEIMYRIAELSEQSRQNPTTVIRGDIDKLQVYLEKLDKEITKVRAASPNDMQAVGESAKAAIKASGALMQSSVMRIDRGF